MYELDIGGNYPNVKVLDDEIKGEGESEIVFATIAKCDNNIALKSIEGMNENIMNVEIALIWKCLENPKY
jgi:hypothetical protein